MRTVRFLLTVALLTATLTAIGSASAAPAPEGAPWKVTATLGLGLDDVSLSCPTIRNCMAAAGGQLLTSFSGGLGWEVRTGQVPDDVAAIVDLDCPSTSLCVLLARRTDGSSAVLTGPATGPATELDAPDAGTATAIACPAPSHCVITDGAKAWITRDRGVTWRASNLPRIAYSDQQIDCVDATNRCVVYGNAGFTPVVDVTTDDGHTWTRQTPGAFDGLYALDCPTVTVCVAGGRTSGSARMTRTTDGGASWQPVSVPAQAYGVRSVACATATSCSAFGLTPGDTPYAWSTANGTTWTAQTVAVVQTTPSPAVECPAAGRCRAVGGGIAYATDDGGTWRDQLLPAAPEIPRGISCVGVTRCVAVGVDAVQRPVALTTVDSGVTWAPHPLPPEVGTPSAIDCVARTTTCVVVGDFAPPGHGGGTMRGAVSTDLGATWQLGGPDTVVGHLWSVSCATTSTCLAGGYDRRSAGLLWRTVDGGHTWKVLTPPPGLSQDNAVSCTGPTTCVVVSNPYGARPVAFVTTNLGQTWRTHRMPGDRDNTTFYNGLDCATATCVAVGSRTGNSVIARSVDGGDTWQDVAAPAGPESLGRGVVRRRHGLRRDRVRLRHRRPAGRARKPATAARPGPCTRVEAGQYIGSEIACSGVRCYVPQGSPLGNPVVVTGSP